MKQSVTFNIITGKNAATTETIIIQALIDLLLEKGVLSREELTDRIGKIRQDVDRKDSYKSSW